MRKLINSLWFHMFLGFAVPLVLFIGAAFVTYVTINRLTQSLRLQEETEESLSKLDNLLRTLKSMAAAKRAHFLLGKREFIEQFNLNRKEFLAELNKLLPEMSDNPKKRQLLFQIQQDEEQWTKQALNSFLIIAERKQLFNKAFIVDSDKLPLEKSMALFDSIIAKIELLRDLEFGEYEQRRKDVLVKTNENFLAIMIAVGVSICVGMFSSWMVTRSISKPLHHLLRAVNSLREGKIETITVFGPSEIIDLIRGFNLMSIALAERNTFLENNFLRYRTVVGTTSHMLWTTSADGKNVDMTNWCALTGQKPEDIVGDGWLNAIHPEDRERFTEHWEFTFHSGNYGEEEFRIRKADGLYGDYHCRSIPIYNTKKEIVEWVRLCVDITDKKQEELLRRERDSAEAASRAKSEFLAKMSHELRTPLNAIIGMSKMLATQRFGQLNEKQQDYLSDVIDAGTHLLTLINDILDLSKVEVGRLELKPEVIRIGETLDGILSTLRSLAADKQLDLRAELPETEGVITTDLARFKQILFNLISNAIKFTPEKGKVTVRCHWVAEPEQSSPIAKPENANAIRVDVADNGIGITKEDQKRIGSEFFQVESDSTKTNEGTGLGLVLCLRLVSLLGGKIWYTSEFGEGSTFSFVLPRKMQERSEEKQSLFAEEQEQLLPTESNVLDQALPVTLIVDDHAPTNKLLSDWLEEAGLVSVSAFDGQSGLAQARKYNPQLILLDVRLPGINGFEVLHQLKSDPATRNIPVGMVTVLEVKEELQELDIVDWFVKPFDKENMIDRLRSSLPDLFADNQNHVMLVDHDVNTRGQWAELLRANGVATEEADDGQQALDLLTRRMPDLILLNLFVPKADGFQIVSAIRSREDGQTIPIIILTERELSEEEREILSHQTQGIYRKDALNKSQFLGKVRQFLFPS